jgi:flagellar FliL protein
MSDEDVNENEDEQPEDGEESDEEGASGGNKKLLIIVAAAVLILGVAGAGLFFTGMLDGLLGKSGTEEMADGEHGKGDGHGKKDDGHGGGHSSSAYFLKVPDMIVNLSTDSEQPRYLKISVELELENQTDRDAVQAVVPRVVNQFQTYLRELRVKDLQGSQGMYRLRMELLSRVNAATYPVEVQNVLFQELLVQ